MDGQDNNVHVELGANRSLYSIAVEYWDNRVDHVGRKFVGMINKGSGCQCSFYLCANCCDINSYCVPTTTLL